MNFVCVYIYIYVIRCMNSVIYIYMLLDCATTVMVL
jgi:hypothetical protein